MAGKHPVISVAPEDPRWNAVLDNVVRFFGSHGFRQITPPPVEEARTLHSSPILAQTFGQNLLGLSGQIEKELVLSPTHLLSVARFYLQALGGSPSRVEKWFYVSPVVRGFDKEPVIEHELGVFILGDESSLASAQLINVVGQSLRTLGIVEFGMKITSRGCPTCQREYQDALQGYLTPLEERLCEFCSRHLAERAINAFSCPVATCQNLLSAAPQMIDFLDEPCRQSLAETLEIVDELGLQYDLDPAITGTLGSEKILFQVSTPAGVNLGQGGHFSALVRRPLKFESPMVGFLSSLELLGNFIPEEARRPLAAMDVFVIPVGMVAARRALLLFRDLQNAGIRVGESMLETSGIKNQLKNATDRKCEIALIIGQKEAQDETVILRDMRSGMQELFTSERIVEEVKKRLGK